MSRSQRDDCDSRRFSFQLLTVDCACATSAESFADSDDTCVAIHCPDGKTFNDFKLPALKGTKRFDYVWLISAILVLVGNLCVLLWRCTRRSDQRSSVPSILIINLAAADLCWGFKCFSICSSQRGRALCLTTRLLLLLSATCRHVYRWSA